VPPRLLVDLAIVRHRALDRRIKPRSRLARQPVLQFEFLLLRRLQMRRDRVQRHALGEVADTHRIPKRIRWSTG
jgi:hypothetical protein